MTPRGTFVGLPLDLLTMDESVERCFGLIEEEQGAEHVVINASKVVLAHDDDRIRAIIKGADVVNADGQSVVWAARLTGLRVPERVAGIDLMEHLLSRAEDKGTPVYFLGAQEEVLVRFVSVVRERFPRLVVAGAANGFYEDETQAARAIAASGARLLLVGMSSPRKEYFVADNMALLGPLLAVGVGGSFDVWAGLVARAPKWMQKWGLEWSYRLFQEPGRMWKRYLVGNARFVWIVLGAALSSSRNSS